MDNNEAKSNGESLQSPRSNAEEGKTGSQPSEIDGDNEKTKEPSPPQVGSDDCDSDVEVISSSQPFTCPYKYNPVDTTWQQNTWV